MLTVYDGLRLIWPGSLNILWRHGERGGQCSCSCSVLLILICLHLCFISPEAAAHRKRFNMASKQSIFYNDYTGNRPIIDPIMHSNITIERGKMAHLPCRISNQGSHRVSWIKYNSKRFEILAVDGMVVAGDERVVMDRTAIIPEIDGLSNWSLNITKLKLSDSGIYECQIGTTPKMGRNLTLHVYKNNHRNRGVRLKSISFTQWIALSGFILATFASWNFL